MNDAEQRVIESLDKIGLPYEVIEIDPDFSDTALFCQKYNFPPEQTCNTILVVSKKGVSRHAVCVIPANTRLDVNKRVKNLLGVAKASFASAEEMMALTGMLVGGVTPFSLPADLPIYVDARIPDLAWIILGGGGRAIKIKIAPAVFAKLGATIVDNLAFEPL
jgi:prolyl-tRNA editing enzyme YbaK/EbsC (Cys-tRNA(Pro) deacylase)